MKILFACNELRGGGTEKVVTTLTNYLLSKEHEVHLIIFNNIIEVDIHEKLNLHIVDVKLKYQKINNLRSKIKILEKDIPFDLIISNNTETDYYMRKLNHPNIFFCIHTTFSKAYLDNKSYIKKLRRLIRFHFRYKNQNIITVCNGVKDDLINKVYIKPKTIRTIYNPIDVNETKKLALEENIIKEKDYIVHVANYGDMKRYDLLISAYKESNIDEKLVLVGNRVKENTYELVEKLGLENKIIYTGYVKNPYPIIKNAKLLVVSSDFEGFGMVIIEALVLNTLVVSTNYTHGASEIMMNELANNLVPTNNLYALADKIKEVLNNKELHNIDFDKYIEKFKVEHIVNQYLELV